ncbi:MAG TPA: PQQ-dependent sugar dehydrogenase [Kofleriaceae bacterium]|jgi:glucose/arabinose dehydrogenase
MCLGTGDALANNMRLAVLLGSLAITLTATRGDASCEQVAHGYGPNGHAGLRVAVVAHGLDVPWGLAFLPDRSLLVTERPGRIDHIVDGRRMVIARVQVAQPSERGLLGLALHPDFAGNHLFYIYYTAETPHGPRNRVERWRLADDEASATADRVIVDGIPSATYHDGGRIAFGPDRMLYIGTGDATEPQSSQDPHSLAGKILRVDPDGGVPADNPTHGSRVYITGVRNVEAFAWRADGALAIAEHGPSGELGRTGHDRVFLLAHPAGANLGWPTIYGCETRAGFAAPGLSWTEAVPPGGAAFDGDDFYIGTLKSEHLHHVRFDHDGGVAEHDVALAGRGRLRTVVLGPDHALYITTSNCDGRGSCPAEHDVILRVTRR